MSIKFELVQLIQQLNFFLFGKGVMCLFGNIVLIFKTYIYSVSFVFETLPLPRHFVPSVFETLTV